MISDVEYQEYVDRLASQELKINLSRSPTTMGPGYIAEKIAEILEAKSIVNGMSEKVELALCDAEVGLNDLEEEVQLRTYIEYQNMEAIGEEFRNAKSREAHVWTRVEGGYVTDHQEEFDKRSTPTTKFQLSEDIRITKSNIIRLKALLTIINHRRDELGKLDSGVRLQQKTMETEAAIYGKSGIPQPSNINNGTKGHVDAGVTPQEVDDNDSPEAIEEDFDTPPHPIKESV